MSEAVDCVVVGGGVIGLAIARRLAISGQEVVILEAARQFGTGISSRNSEVIHAGLYHPTGSLKARLCLDGRRALYAYCRERGIAHQNPGKLIVAANWEQADRLEVIAGQAKANGVDDLEMLTAAQARALEPELACCGALWSPSTGLIDSHGLMLALLGDAEAHGATIAYCTAFQRADVVADGFIIEIGGADGDIRLACRCLINAAGLMAWDVAEGVGDGLAPAPARYLAKGNYFSLSGCRTPFSHLIYPVPEEGGLGVHLTLDLGGQARFGPDVEWLEGVAPQAIDYRVRPERAEHFYAAIRRYWPGLPDGALIPAYAGVRPKLSGQGMSPADFMIAGPADHGILGFVNLLGIESPGLTSCLAIADEVYRRLT